MRDNRFCFFLASVVQYNNTARNSKRFCELDPFNSRCSQYVTGMVVIQYVRLGTLLSYWSVSL